ncbi:LOW QUALITY PROTEIN: soyasapogenol B glucuronide galactosyltransferase-like [Benincasa hispida]|uniref:LOW QUALITY PROTEIN: soyasapogenol B glucuronide galactosyltransferase-like n=1 Tax=Benincasa hispida TaxID=102211 RepID=UPI001900D1E0|nr:LOW QUALITY PROTEIN: soyasapogenol B glucuronide galactosyltransferase-like [Benincasa hispida]
MFNKIDELNIIFLPFVSHGHLIPLVDVATLFAELGVIVTIVTTDANAALFRSKIHRDSVSGSRIRLHTIPWPAARVGLSPAIQNLSTATPMAMPKVLEAFLMLQPQLEDLIHEMRPDCIVADIFYPWTTKVAAELGIPRLAFNGSSFFGYCAEECIRAHKPHLEVESNNDKFKLPGLPDVIEMTKSQLPSWITTQDDFSRFFDVIKESERQCYGIIMNSFHELESSYEEHMNKVLGIKTWSIGPVSLLANKEVEDKEYRGGNPSIETTNLLQWLNEKEPKSVLYINFGSLVQTNPNQITEIAHAIRESSHNFIWVVKRNNEDDDDIVNEGFPKGFEENMIKSKKCLIIRGWAPQLMILEHESVGGFVTHCGWNSILEGVSAGLPMITWPLFAEQFYNEKLLIEVVKNGVGVGSKKWWHLGEEKQEIVNREDIGKAVDFVMGGSVEALEMRKRLKKWERQQQGL